MRKTRSTATLACRLKHHGPTSHEVGMREKLDAHTEQTVALTVNDGGRVCSSLAFIRLLSSMGTEKWKRYQLTADGLLIASSTASSEKRCLNACRQCRESICGLVKSPISR